MVYIDSSAFVRLYLEEALSTQVRAYVAQLESMSCVSLGFVEVRAALAAAKRANRIDEQQHSVFKQQFHSLWKQCDRLNVDDLLLARAADLAEYGKLRGFDAMHLAAAERLKLGGIRNLQFLCFDQALVHAAKMLGIACPDL